jgi:hypothetical protein
MAYTLKLLDRADDYEFRFDGVSVGRTYARPTPEGAKWYWSLYGINLKGPTPDGVIVQGLAEDLEGAKAAFLTNFEKLQAAGNVRLKKPASDEA